MPKYTFKDGPVRLTNSAEADAQELGKAIEGPSRAIERKIAAGIKLDEADALTRQIHADVMRDKEKHPFHKHLEWNKTRGAYLYRLSQIGAIIRIIRVVDDKTGDQVPAFVSVKSSDGERQSYRPLQVVVGSLELQIATLRQAEADLQAFRRRYKVLADVCEGVAALEKKISDKRKGLMGDRPGVSTAA